jgi:radical SAM superfamily enzyme YgiQ (UPF0313 family)/ubiquinone/menaquinone biosynthesis C-methylase UbiE
MHCNALGLAYLAAAATENGDAVELIDRNIFHLRNMGDTDITDKLTMDEIRRFEPDIIVFSATITVMNDVKHFSSAIKKIMPSVKIIVADTYPASFYSFEPEENLKNCPHVDIAIRGEGEKILVDIINNLASLPAVKGICFRNNDTIVSTGEAEQVINLDDIPMPRRDLLDMNFYSAALFEAGFYGRGTTIFSSRGCHNNCNYCLNYNLNPNLKLKHRFHSANRVVAEIENILSLCKVDCLYFFDDDFLCDKSRVIDLCENIIKKGLNKKIEWIAQTRAEISRMDEATLRLMKSAGCVQLEFGLESGSQEELDRMNKRIKLKDYFKTVELVKKIGIRIQSDFIVGYPGQTAADLKKTISFIKKIKPTHIATLRYMPLPGTQAYENLKNNGFKPHFGDLGQKHNFTAMTDQELADISNKILIPLKIRINRENFVLYYLRKNPILLLRLTLEKLLTFLSEKLGLRRRKVLENSDWDKGVASEIYFWDNWLKKQGGRRWKQEHLRRCNSNSNLQNIIVDYLDKNKTEHSILDVGAGPLTRVGKLYKGNRIEIHAVDPLAKKYDVLLKKYNIQPIVRTKECYGENLSEMFAENTFDVVYSFNAIDHSINPVKCLREMIKVTKRGRFIILEVFEKEGRRALWRGLHKWGFFLKETPHGKRILCISGKNIDKINVEEKLAETAELTHLSKNQRVITAVFRKLSA